MHFNLELLKLALLLPRATYRTILFAAATFALFHPQHLHGALEVLSNAVQLCPNEVMFLFFPFIMMCCNPNLNQFAGACRTETLKVQQDKGKHL